MIGRVAPCDDVKGLQCLGKIGRRQALKTRRVDDIGDRRTDLLFRINHALPDIPEGSAEYVNALINPRNIRTVLARRDLTP